MNIEMRAILHGLLLLNHLRPLLPSFTLYHLLSVPTQKAP